jgi:hypothetical protein
MSINAKTARSSKSLSGSTNRVLARRNRRLKLKVSAIVLTDFICWIPFMIICFLHFGEVIDATLWYPIFSNIILPINSVINPLLYDPLLGAALFRPFKAFYSKTSTAISTIRHRIISLEEPAANIEQIEMKSGSAI